MTPALIALGWCLVLAVVQIMLPATVRTQEVGLTYNAGPRDGDEPPMGVLTGRLKRAQANLFETLPLFGLAVLIAWAAHRESHLVDLAAWTFLGARIVYLPLYAFGVPYVRTLAFLAALAALLVIVFEILKPIVTFA